jgi:hypothetical protein
MVKNHDGIYYELDFLDIVLLNGQVSAKKSKDSNRNILLRV